MTRKARQYAPCPYPDHRPSDWRLKTAKHLVCGICHPPVVPEDQIVRRPPKPAEPPDS